MNPQNINPYAEGNPCFYDPGDPGDPSDPGDLSDLSDPHFLDSLDNPDAPHSLKSLKTLFPLPDALHSSAAAPKSRPNSYFL